MDFEPYPPNSPVQPVVNITINGTDLSVAPGTTILDAMGQIGETVPTLCYSDQLAPYGACRSCLVEVEDGKPVAACHTGVTDNAAYQTHSTALTRYRRNLAEMIVSDHPLECLDCAANGRCELQTMAQQVGLRENRYQAPRTHKPIADRSHPFIKLDMEKCIGCARCVRVCDEIQGSFILGMAGRGYDTRVVAGNDTGMEQADCASCGQCVVECPVAALEEPGTLEFGIPDQITTTTCAYCGVGCTLDVAVKDQRVISITPSQAGSANRGHACVKGRFAHQFAQSKDRLTTPLIKDSNGVFQPASWDQALELVARRFAEIRDQHGSNALAVISSSRCTNEENFIMQKFTRVALGTNSVDNCSRVCHSPSAYALRTALGTGAGTNSFEDVEHSDLLMIVGANPTEAHPVFGARIKQAVLSGCKLIVLDPRNTELAQLADIHLPLRPGSNVAVINALQQLLISQNLIDHQFIDQHSEGFEQISADLADCTPEWASDLSGVDSELIRQAATLYGNASAAQILWGLGVTEAGHGSNAVFGLINMAVMTGNLGRPGTGTCPIRGQNNVQGASDMGALPNTLSDYRPVDDPIVRDHHLRVWGVEPPTNTGLRIPDMFDAAVEGSLKALYILAEDVAQSDPNTDHVTAALESLDFLVVQEIFMNPTAEFADVILPGVTFLEKEGTFVNSDRRIQRVRQVIPPVAGSRPDGDITNAIAREMGIDLGFDSGPNTPIDPAKIMREIATLGPKWGGVNYPRLEQEGFLQWPCYDSDDPGTTIVHQDGNFLRGKALLSPTPWQPAGEIPDDQYPLMLTTGRMLFHYNVGTMTRRTDLTKLQAGKQERLRIHPKDARRYDLSDGDKVNVISRRGQVRVSAEITKATNPGVLFMTFHFPESRTNILTGNAVDEFTGCPEYKVVAVQLKKTAA